jgi:hypothetical protein
MSPSTKDFISDRDESTASRLVPLMPLDQAELCARRPRRRGEDTQIAWGHARCRNRVRPTDTGVLAVMQAGGVPPIPASATRR